MAIYELWLGGEYENFGSYDDKEDAERGIIPNERMCEILDDYKGKRVRLTVEVISE